MPQFQSRINNVASVTAPASLLGIRIAKVVKVEAKERKGTNF